MNTGRSLGQSRDHVIWSKTPASEWAEGYPLGNGRLGAMVLGDVMRDRIALNHDRLWRRFWRFQEHHTAGDFPRWRQLMREGKWDEAHAQILQKIPASGAALYVNPFVPACDLGIYPFHGQEEISKYRRQLNLSTATAEVTYLAGGIAYKRQYFVSWPAGVIVIRLSASQAARVRGEISLSRLLDPDCSVTGTSGLGKIALQGQFEEGVRFAAAVRIIQRGGRLTNGRQTYAAPVGQMPPKDLNGLRFTFRDPDPNPHPELAGVSTCFDCADEVVVLASIVTDEDTTDDPLALAEERVNGVSPDFDELYSQHIADHQQLYNRSFIRLGDDHADKPMEDLLADARANGKPSPRVYELLFHMGRYLAIASGRPAHESMPPKAPINLQGIWNQDRKPAWDCDYHLDLNVQMNYWALDAANLGELMQPFAAWSLGLLPQAKRLATDLYGCRGACYGVTADPWYLGNVDDLCFTWTGAGAWLAQVLWQHWQYSGDGQFLRETLYPLLEALAQFYEDYLTSTEDGHLVPFPSASPEMGVKGRQRYSSMSSPSAMDLELIHDMLSHVLIAGEKIGVNPDKLAHWRNMLQRVPLPAVDAQGVMMEWLDAHEPTDPYHRHRSPLVGLVPGERITLEDTPNDFHAAAKLLALRKSDPQSACGFAASWDCQLLARLYKGNAAIAELDALITTWLMPNMLLSICDYHADATTLQWFPGRKVFQIEASLGVVGGISELLLQDRRGILRFLPALPDSWPDGEIKGLRARDGFEVDVRWQQGQLVSATILSLRGMPCRFQCMTPGSALRVMCDNQVIVLTRTQWTYEFPTHTGKTYILIPQ